ncbi:MAG: hypothetical protein R2788_04810 [Saprospiraceae bacterium]
MAKSAPNGRQYEVMKSWVDTCLAHDNIWLVLVFHGVDGLANPRQARSWKHISLH